MASKATPPKMHDELAHFETDKTSPKGQREVFLAPMSLDIEEWCRNCLPFQEKKNPVPSRRAPLHPIVTRRPGELVTMDIVEYPLSSQGYRYCLVMVDHFTKWLELYPLKDQKPEFDCLVYEMLFIKALKPNLNVQSDSIRVKIFS